MPAPVSVLLVAALGAGCAGPPESEPALDEARSAPAPLVVAAGETACTLAGRHGVAADALLRANGLAGSPEQALAPGTRLRLPDDAPLFHHVRAGETLFVLSRHYGVTVEALARANGLDDPDSLPAGLDLRIPAGAGTGCAPPAPAVSAAPARRPAGQAPVDRLGQADALLARARERYEAADFGRAIELTAVADHALAPLDPGPEVVRRRAQSAWIAGAAWTGLGRREEALDRFRRVLELDPAVAEQEPASPRVRALVDEARGETPRP